MTKANILTFIFLGLFLQIFSQQDTKMFANFDSNHDLEIACNLDTYGSVYRISKTFSQSIDEIIAYNQIKDVSSLKPGQIIKVKINKNKISHKPSAASIPLYYTVLEGETLYRIARTYMAQDINQFIELNKLSNHTLQKDAVLLLGYLHTTTNSVVNTIEIVSTDTVLAEPMTLPEITYVKQKGIAYVNGRNAKQEGYYVLHSDAKINSEVEIYNPMARRTTKAKVIGKIPKGTYNPDINVVLSKATAKSLGALDARFMVEIKYVQN
jgi:LysM repeat protein